MMNDTNKNTDLKPYVLPEKMTISESEEHYQLLTESIENKNSLELDATAVEKIDTAALQLLAVLLKGNDDKNIKISWHGISKELEERAAILGLSECLSKQ